MYFKLLSIPLLSILLIACNGGNQPGGAEQAAKETPKYVDLLPGVPFKVAPITDSTNFDNFDGENELSEDLVAKLQLKTIEPDYENFYSRYRIALSTPVDMVVITMKIENEMKTFLITYRKSDYKMIDKLLIAYDEIAESMSRAESKIISDNIAVTTYNYWGEEPSVETKRYHVEKSGKIILK